VTRPPFDRPDVRRAVALAVDRQAAVLAFGGRDVARPTCQILPPTFPGYRPFCPFRTQGLNASRLCDPKLDRGIARATGLQTRNAAAANAAWQAVDRDVTNRVAWVPLVNPVGVDLLAGRVGNYLRNPAFGVLLDQLWVR
jgi:ABC-type transport system substrate-binding protein